MFCGNGQKKNKGPLKLLSLWFLMDKSWLIMMCLNTTKIVLQCLTKKVGACLDHVMPNGVEQSVACASQSIQGAEKNYAQICKAGGSKHFVCCKRFHQYLCTHNYYGSKFVLVTDPNHFVSSSGKKKVYQPWLQ